MEIIFALHFAGCLCLSRAVAAYFSTAYNNYNYSVKVFWIAEKIYIIHVVVIGSLSLIIQSVAR